MNSTCIHCHSEFSFEENQRGTQSNCPHCQNIIFIPDIPVQTEAKMARTPMTETDRLEADAHSTESASRSLFFIGMLVIVVGGLLAAATARSVSVVCSIGISFLVWAWFEGLLAQLKHIRALISKNVTPLPPKCNAVKHSSTDT